MVCAFQISRRFSETVEKNAKQVLLGRLLYEIWRGMKRRCFRVTATDYAAYGGRGIVVCCGWRGSF